MQYKQKGGIYPLNEIKAGYLLVVEDVKTREVYNMTVLPGNRGSFDAGALGCANKEANKYWPIRYFNKQLIYVEENELRIKAIYGVTCNKYLLDGSIEHRDLLWERKEAKKMTVKEICDALGYDVEIVKEKEPEE